MVWMLSGYLSQKNYPRTILLGCNLAFGVIAELGFDFCWHDLRAIASYLTPSKSTQAVLQNVLDNEPTEPRLVPLAQEPADEP